MQSTAATLENILIVFYLKGNILLKSYINILLYKSATPSLPKEVIYIYTKIKYYTNFILKKSKLETTQVSITCEMDIQIRYIPTVECENHLVVFAFLRPHEL